MVILGRTAGCFLYPLSETDQCEIYDSANRLVTTITLTLGGGSWTQMPATQFQVGTSLATSAALLRRRRKQRRMMEPLFQRSAMP
jgi:hypothetical protein